jgi:hypothetical protein
VGPGGSEREGVARHERGRARMGRMGREWREGSAGARERERGVESLGRIRPNREGGERDFPFFLFLFLFYFLFLNPFSPINKYSSKFLRCQNEILYVKCH